MTVRWYLPLVFAALFSVAFCRPGQAADPACGSAACLNLLFDGDSISVGYGAAPPNRLDARVTGAVGGNVRMHNVAVGGRPVNDCLRLYPELVAPLFDPTTHHNVIVFHAGDNDISEGRDAAQTYTAFTAYVATAHHQGWKVIVSTELRRRDFIPSQEASLVEYNSMLRQNRAGADAVVDFDADSRMTNMSDRSNPAVFSPDGIHPSDGGYKVLAAMVAPVVKRIAER